MERGVLPPTANVENVDPEIPLDVIPGVAREARRTQVMHVLSNSFGFGGTNASLVVSRWG
jgi:3-oxoacyl-[acyl-carrier-protein] synthase II